MTSVHLRKDPKITHACHAQIESFIHHHYSLQYDEIYHRRALRFIIPMSRSGQSTYEPNTYNEPRGLKYHQSHRVQRTILRAGGARAYRGYIVLRGYYRDIEAVYVRQSMSGLSRLRVGNGRWYWGSRATSLTNKFL